MGQDGWLGAAFACVAALAGWALTVWLGALAVGLIVFGGCRFVLWLRRGGDGSVV